MLAPIEIVDILNAVLFMAVMFHMWVESCGFGEQFNVIFRT